MHTAKTTTDFSQVIEILIVSKAAKPQSKAKEQATLFHFIFSRRKQSTGGGKPEHCCQMKNRGEKALAHKKEG